MRTVGITRSTRQPTRCRDGTKLARVSLSIGIVGLPNVGKSTLFNALTRASALAANYPFATIEPNVGVVGVPDPRLAELATLYDSARIVPASVRFTDIAGLVRGASQGQGLGNQFLAHIRETDAICQVVRVFADPDVTHVDGDVSPERDIETVVTELILADLQTLDKALPRLAKETRFAKDPEKAQAVTAAEAAAAAAGLRHGAVGRRQGSRYRPARAARAAPADGQAVPLRVQRGRVRAGRRGPAQAADRAVSPRPRRSSWTPRPRLTWPSCPRTRRPSCWPRPGWASRAWPSWPGPGSARLAWQTFLTAGPKETRAWEIPAGATAPEAAGVIHTDFQRGFIKAEVVSYDDLIAAGSLPAARSAGKARIEGKDYVMRDGDVVEFRFNV